MRAKSNSPSLVEELTYYCKGMYQDIVVKTGNVEPDLLNKLVPGQFGSPDV